MCGASLDLNGVFEVGVGQHLASPLLGKLLDMETISPAAEDDPLASTADFDDEISNPAPGTSRDTLCNNIN